MTLTRKHSVIANLCSGVGLLQEDLYLLNSRSLTSIQWTKAHNAYIHYFIFHTMINI